MTKKKSAFEQYVQAKRKQLERQRKFYEGEQGVGFRSLIDGMPDPLKDIEEDIANLENLQKETATPDLPTANPIRWIGSDTDLADLFLTLREKYYIEAASDYAVFQQLGRHFVGRKSKIYKPGNLKLLANKRALFGTSPFKSITENQK